VSDLDVEGHPLDLLRPEPGSETQETNTFQHHNHPKP
jgi:hypothetical protein